MERLFCCLLKDKASKRTKLYKKKKKMTGQGRLGHRKARKERENKKEITEETNE